jgi:hypothetical protein
VKAYQILSDLLLAIHFGFVAFIVLGFIVIWLGYFCGWPFVHRPGFRILHLLAMGLVLLESLMGWICPLTARLRWALSMPPCMTTTSRCTS